MYALLLLWVLVGKKASNHLYLFKVRARLVKMTVYEIDFQRYLRAKAEIDDRALNRYVWSYLTNAISSEFGENLLRVLEIGCGIGTMVERMLSWNLLQSATYLGIDNQLKNLIYAMEGLSFWGERNGFLVNRLEPFRVRMVRDLQDVVVNFESIDLFEFLEKSIVPGKFDLVVAHAFLDLVDIESTIPGLFSLLHPGGYYYFTLNFDGGTIFEPVIDSFLDSEIERLYHQSMDERQYFGKPSGSSRTGRKLIAFLNHKSSKIMAAGSSDWVVYPSSGTYSEDETYFLHYILHFIESTLEGHPELDQARFRDWISVRQAQIERGELVYIAHQIDVMGSWSGLG